MKCFYLTLNMRCILSSQLVLCIVAFTSPVVQTAAKTTRIRILHCSPPARDSTQSTEKRNVNNPILKTSTIATHGNSTS